MKPLTLILGALAFLVAAIPAAAQDAYPSKPIRIVVGYSAGGGNDIIVRVMTPELSKGLGQPVIVDNKPGAQGIIAAELVAKSAPDGYTLLMGPSGPMTINPAIYSKLPYSPLRDFAPPVVAGPSDSKRARHAGHGGAGMDGVVRAGQNAPGDRRAAAAGSCAR